MDEGNFPAAEKILSDIEMIFKKDPKLRGFEILPMTMNENKSPVHHMEHCLGLESWCVPHVYCHAYTHIMNLRQTKAYREDYNRTNRLLMGALMLNPEVTSFWNMRKDLMVKGKLDPYFELLFTGVVLYRKPKCADVFVHRKWVIKKMLKDPGLVAHELHVCEIAADRYSNNYHAWTHRIWCLSQVGDNPKELMTTLVGELGWSESWVTSHVSDYSGFQYRQQLISRLIRLVQDNQHLNNSTELLASASLAAQKFLQRHNHKGSVERLKVPHKLALAELALNTRLMDNMPGHEALWCHRRFILHMLKEHSRPKIKAPTFKSFQHLNQDGVPLEKDAKLDSPDFQWFLFLIKTNESTFIGQQHPNDKQNMLLVNHHQQWMDNVLKL